LYRRLVGSRVRSQMQYKTSFVLQAIGNFGTNVVELAAIFILFRHFDSMGGWTVGDVAFLYGLSAISFACADAIASGFSTFSLQIVRGEFDRVLVRPVAPFLQVLAADFQMRRVGRLLQGVIAFALALRLTDVQWSPGRLLFLPVVLFSAIVLFTALFTLEATMCFWTTQSTEVVNAFTYGGTTLAQYPLHVFDVWLRRLFLFVVPIGFVIFEPATYLLDRPDPLGLPPICRFLAPVFAVVFALAAGGLWRFGVAHYRSTGS
jgi:ABC-2 type transport system permease protein